MDVVLPVSPQTLEDLGYRPGGCVAISKEEVARIEAAVGTRGMDRALLVPGGSAANVVKGIAKVSGAESGFVGTVGDDTVGSTYRDKLKEEGVDPLLHVVDGAVSPKCYCLVTDDGERTMRCFLGDCGPSKRFDPAWLKGGYGLVHLEGYALYNTEYALNLMRKAKEAGMRVSMDLSSFELVRNFYDTIMHDVLEAGLLDYG